MRWIPAKTFDEKSPARDSLFAILMTPKDSSEISVLTPSSVLLSFLQNNNTRLVLFFPNNNNNNNNKNKIARVRDILIHDK